MRDIVIPAILDRREVAGTGLVQLIEVRCPDVLRTGGTHACPLDRIPDQADFPGADVKLVAVGALVVAAEPGSLVLRLARCCIKRQGFCQGHVLEQWHFGFEVSLEHVLRGVVVRTEILEVGEGLRVEVMDGRGGVATVFQACGHRQRARPEVDQFAGYVGRDHVLVDIDLLQQVPVNVIERGLRGLALTERIKGHAACCRCGQRRVGAECGAADNAPLRGGQRGIGRVVNRIIGPGPEGESTRGFYATAARLVDDARGAGDQVVGHFLVAVGVRVLVVGVPGPAACQLAVEAEGDAVGARLGRGGTATLAEHLQVEDGCRAGRARAARGGRCRGCQRGGHAGHGPDGGRNVRVVREDGQRRAEIARLQRLTRHMAI